MITPGPPPRRRSGRRTCECYQPGCRVCLHREVNRRSYWKIWPNGKAGMGRKVGFVTDVEFEKKLEEKFKQEGWD